MSVIYNMRIAATSNKMQVPPYKGLLLILIMMVMGLGEVCADTWDGSTKTAPDMSTNNGSSETLAIQITKAAELAWLGDQMKAGNTANKKTYGDKYWKLTADIDLGGNSEFTGKDWASVIGNDTKVFCGYFDGGGHTVSNIQVASATSAKYYGLFPSVQGASTTNVSTIKDLNIDGVYFKATASIGKTTRIGALAGYLKQASVSNIDISNVKFTYTGGISDENDLGGAVGCAETTASIESVSVTTFDAAFTGATTNLYVAGLVGKINSLTTVSKCSTSNVTITYNTIANASRIAGLIGFTKGAASAPIKINGCSVSNTKVELKAGINNGSYIGALVAQTQDNTQIGDGTDANKNTVTSPDINIGGDIKAASYIGGAIGDLAGATDETKTSVVKNMKVTSPSVTVNKNSVTNSYIGATFGRINTFSVVKSVAVSDPTLTYKATDNPNYALNLGSFAGYIVGNATQEVAVTDIDITGDAQVVLGTGSSNLSNIRAGLVGYANTNVRLEDWTIENTEVQVKGNLTTATSYLGGVVGYSYTNATNTPVTIKDVQVEDCDISLDGNISIAAYVGGIVGMLKAYATTSENANSIQQCSISGKIRSTGSHTFTENITYAFGGIVGYTDQSATAISVIEQCTSNVDFNLSGFTPVKVSGSNYNLYRSGFVVGGVIGRLNTPSRLPEHLYYSGKIYAPFAAVGPVVGVFNTNLNAAAYVYDDYVGTNATNVTAEEWKKADSWYYNGYKLGLSSDVISQTARTKNYKTSPVVDNGVSYLTVDDKTFDRPNEISGAVKNSYTVLAYTANNTDKDMGIFPQWNTNSATYPAYYMYYMQGLNRGKYVPDDEVDFVKTLMASGITFYPTLTRTGDDEHGYVFTVDPGDAETTDGFTLTYQWYQSDKTTLITGETGKTLSMTKDELEAVGNTVFCVVTVSGTEFTSVSRTLRGSYAIVVFVNGNNYTENGAEPGIDTNDGLTPQTPVKTIDKANSLLDGGPWDKNIIVVMGLLNPGTDEAFRSKGTNPATLTGKWDGLNYEGEIKIVKTGETGANNTQSGSNGFHNYVKGDTKFEYLTIRANKNSDDNNFFDCHGNDVWFGKGLVMTNFRNLGANHGNLNSAQKVPELTILMTATNLSEADIQTYTNRNKPQTLTIESGHYGRILAGRFTQAFFTNSGNTSHTILGSVAHPMWAVINVDIDKDNQMTDGGSTIYTCDINCIVAGLTDGSMYGDYEINVRGGKVEYVVGGNQGNPAANGSMTFTQPGGKSGTWGQWPNASFYGRSVINVEQDTGLKDITIGNLYAGGLGRDLQSSGSATVVDMYMYGQTEINMKSGTVTGNVYGGGAGGVIGLSPWDMHMPYATTAADDATNAIMNKVQYGTWGSMPAGSPLASVALHNSDGNGGYTTTELDLSESSTTLNISGGTINGSVYGGGCGFVNNMPDKVAMQGVGSVFGTSNVNVSGGTIHGSVYGGSEGNPGYYGKTNNYGQTIKHIAEMNGTVNLKVTGTDVQYPTIGGNIYGAGMGIATNGTEEYFRIATAGNAELGGETPDKYKTDINITIDLPESHPFTGNIYGGGQMGAVDGTTKVVIKGGIIEGDVFGGGMGEIGHPNKAKVTGETNVIVDSNWTEPAPQP